MLCKLLLLHLAAAADMVVLAGGLTDAPKASSGVDGCVACLAHYSQRCGGFVCGGTHCSSCDDADGACLTCLVGPGSPKSKQVRRASTAAQQAEDADAAGACAAACSKFAPDKADELRRRCDAAQDTAADGACSFEDADAAKRAALLADTEVPEEHNAIIEAHGGEALTLDPILKHTMLGAFTAEEQGELTARPELMLLLQRDILRLRYLKDLDKEFFSKKFSVGYSDREMIKDVAKGTAVAALSIGGMVGIAGVAGVLNTIASESQSYVSFGSYVVNYQSGLYKANKQLACEGGGGGQGASSKTEYWGDVPLGMVYDAYHRVLMGVRNSKSKAKVLLRPVRMAKYTWRDPASEELNPAKDTADGCLNYDVDVELPEHAVSKPGSRAQQELTGLGFTVDAAQVVTQVDAGSIVGKSGVKAGDTLSGTIIEGQIQQLPPDGLAAVEAALEYNSVTFRFKVKEFTLRRGQLINLKGGHYNGNPNDRVILWKDPRNPRKKCKAVGSLSADVNVRWEQGAALGFTIDVATKVVTHVDPGSVVEQSGVNTGDELSGTVFEDASGQFLMPTPPDGFTAFEETLKQDHLILRFKVKDVERAHIANQAWYVYGVASTAGMVSKAYHDKLPILTNQEVEQVARGEKVPTAERLAWGDVFTVIAKEKRQVKAFGEAERLSEFWKLGDSRGWVRVDGQLDRLLGPRTDAQLETGEVFQALGSTLAPATPELWSMAATSGYQTALKHPGVVGGKIAMHSVLFGCGFVTFGATWVANAALGGYDAVQSASLAVHLTLMLRTVLSYAVAGLLAFEEDLFGAGGAGDRPGQRAAPCDIVKAAETNHAEGACAANEVCVRSGAFVHDNKRNRFNRKGKCVRSLRPALPDGSFCVVDADCRSGLCDLLLELPAEGRDGQSPRLTALGGTCQEPCDPDTNAVAGRAIHHAVAGKVEVWQFSTAAEGVDEIEGPLAKGAAGSAVYRLADAGADAALAGIVGQRDTYEGVYLKCLVEVDDAETGSKVAHITAYRQGEGEWVELEPAIDADAQVLMHFVKLECAPLGTSDFDIGVRRTQAQHRFRAATDADDDVLGFDVFDRDAADELAVGDTVEVSVPADVRPSSRWSMSRWSMSKRPSQAIVGRARPYHAVVVGSHYADGKLQYSLRTHDGLEKVADAALVAKLG